MAKDSANTRKGAVLRISFPRYAGVFSRQVIYDTANIAMRRGKLPRLREHSRGGFYGLVYVHLFGFLFVALVIIRAKASRLGPLGMEESLILRA